MFADISIYTFSGLWKFCNETKCFDVDSEIVRNLIKNRPNMPEWLRNGEIPFWLRLTRSCLFVAIAFDVIAIGVTVTGIFVKKVHGYYTSIFSVGMFIFTVIPVYTYMEETDYFKEEVVCGRGWGIAFSTVILSFLSSFIGFCIF